MAAKKPSAASKRLPRALAERAEKNVALKRERLAAEGRADLALIKARRQRIVEDFYDIGEALLRLKRPGVAEALGHKNFAALLRSELDMSLSKAVQLIAVVNAVPRHEARAMGQERAAALLDLSRATPEQDSASALATSVLKLPSGKRVPLAKASTREIREAAKAVRNEQAIKQKPRRGVTTTAEERASATALEEALHSLGLKEARVSAVAKPGGGAHARIERVPIASFRLLAKAIVAMGAKPAAEKRGRKSG
jgi:hypothetical protein